MDSATKKQGTAMDAKTRKCCADWDSA